MKKVLSLVFFFCFSSLATAQAPTNLEGEWDLVFENVGFVNQVDDYFTTEASAELPITLWLNYVGGDYSYLSFRGGVWNSRESQIYVVWNSQYRPNAADVEAHWTIRGGHFSIRCVLFRDPAGEWRGVGMGEFRTKFWTEVVELYTTGCRLRPYNPSGNG